jgi:hypothetical protein
LSYGQSETVNLHVATTADVFDIEIVRDGEQPHVVFAKSGVKGLWPETPQNCSVVGCGWPVTIGVEIPREWRSGVYRVVTHVRDREREVSHQHLFIVRGSTERRNRGILLVAATSTWIAYNDWGGSNHYDGITGPKSDQFSPVLSIERPWSRGFVVLPQGAPRIPLTTPPPIGAAPRYPHMEWAYANGYSKKYASAGWASYERHFVRWAETNGYVVDIVSQHDLHFQPELLEGYDCVVIVGHDEYWSWEMRDAVDGFVDNGGKLARFGGNFLWQIRLEDDGKRQACYKYTARTDDPLRDAGQRHRTTTCWDAPEIGRPAALTMGLSGTRGIYAGWGGCVPRGAGGFSIYRPDHWAFEGTDLYYGDLLGASSRVFGYEVDAVDYVVENGLPIPTHKDGAPNGIEILAMGLASVIEEDHGNLGADLFIGDGDVRFVAEAVLGEASTENIDRMKRGAGMIATYKRGRGQVFNAGTCEWVAGLIARDPAVERVTRNVLDRYTQQSS